MLIQRFDYKELKRQHTNGSRKYITPDGFAVPSVTTILGATQPEEKKKTLRDWRNRVGHKKAQEITTEAAGRGTRMHKWLEDYVRTGEIGIPGSNPYSQHSHSMAQLIIDSGLKNCQEFWGTEVSLYFPEVYAGTTDLVGVHDNAECIMDFKQTNKPKKREWIDDYFLQLVAYAVAHNEIYKTTIRKGVVFMASAPKQEGNTWSKPQYQEFIIEGKEFDNYIFRWYDRLETYYTSLL